MSLERLNHEFQRRFEREVNLPDGTPEHPDTEPFNNNFILFFAGLKLTEEQVKPTEDDENVYVLGAVKSKLMAVESLGETWRKIRTQEATTFDNIYHLLSSFYELQREGRSVNSDDQTPQDILQAQEAAFQTKYNFFWEQMNPLMRKTALAMIEAGLSEEFVIKLG
jgi:hypothetical protein